MKIFTIIGGICGILSGIGMIYGGIMDGEMPKYVWLLISTGYFILVVSLIANYIKSGKK